MACRSSYNPDFVGNPRTRRPVAGTLAHEVMHPALHHHVRRSGRDPRAIPEYLHAIYAINPLLVDAGLPYSLPEESASMTAFAQ